MSERRAVAVQAVSAGGTEVLEQADLSLESPAAGQVQVANHSCGVNFIDIYQRSGLYPLPMPATMGNEAAGVVESIGEGVEGFSVGDEVAYCTAGTGCYVSHRNIPADRAIPVREGLGVELAGGCMLRGLTAEYLARRCWPVVAGVDALVTAAAGGVGKILCQWLGRLGARVVGVVGSKEKTAPASENGCDEVLVGYGNIGERLRDIRPDGVGVAYDSVGAATWPGVLDALAPRGCLVSYGNASGPVPQFALLELASRGSLYVTRPTLAHYAATRSELLSAARAFFDEVGRGLALPKVVSMPLADAAKAHAMLEGRKQGGVIVLDPRMG